MKQLEFFYQEAQIHFLIHGTRKRVMINATEMAKHFDRRLDHFLRSQTTKNFILSRKSKMNLPQMGEIQVVNFLQMEEIHRAK